MLTFFSVVHVLLCVFMMFVILLQPGKDAGMGAALGGGAATSAFGGRGAVTFLGKVTAFCATAFFMTSLGLSFVGLRSSVAVVDDDVPAATAPATPPAGAPSGAATGETPAGPATGVETRSGEADKEGPPPAPLPPASEAPPAERVPTTPE